MSDHLNLIGLMPLVFGLAIVAFAELYGRSMITHMERQLRLMRRPGFVWVYRAFGLLFVLFGLFILLFTE